MSETIRTDGSGVMDAESRVFSMNDLISRQAAIEAIERNAYRHTYLDQIIDIVRVLPSAQPESRWIPCTEALPEKGGNYLVTAELKGYVYVMPSFFVREHTAYWVCAVKIIAWQPLPEPYKESENE